MPPRRLAAILVGAIVAIAVVAVAQLVLPNLAERRLRGDLADVGEPLRVEVGAFPALKLLWHRADQVTVRMRSYRSGSGRLGDLIGRAGNVGRLDASATTVEIFPLRLRDARLTQREEDLAAAASLSDSDLRRSLPPGLDVRPVASGGGKLVLEGTLGALGFQASGRAQVLARNGRIVLQPDGVPFAGLAAITLFRSDRLAVTGVAAEPQHGGFRVSATGRVRRGS